MGETQNGTGTRGFPQAGDAPSGRPVTPAAYTSTPKAGTGVLLSCFTRGFWEIQH